MGALHAIALATAILLFVRGLAFLGTLYYHSKGRNNRKKDRK